MRQTLLLTITLSGLILLFSCQENVSSNGGSGVTTDTTVPAAGSAITYSGTSATSTTVSWDAATDNATAQASLQYKLVKASTGTDIDSVSEADAITGANLIMDWTTHTIARPVTGLSASTPYYFAVLVKDAAGNKALYAPVSVTTTATADMTAPTAGTAISFSGTSSSGITVNWGAATDNLTLQANLQYKVVKSPVSSSIDTVGEADAITGADLIMDWTVNATTKTVTGLTASTTYYFAVLVKDAAGNKALYTPAEVATIDAPAAPTLTHGNNQLSVSWSAVTGATAYEVWYYTADNSTSASKFGSDITSGTSATITGLTNATTYYVWIKTKNAAGTSGFSPSSSKLLAPNIPSTYPSLTSGLTQITATWTAVTGATAYEVWYNTANDSAAASKFGSDITSGTTATITGLANGTLYYIWIKAKNSTGTNGFSASNGINTTISIGEIMAGNSTHIDNDRISFGKTFAAVPKIVVNAYDAAGKPLVAGVRTETGLAPDKTGFTVKLSDLDGTAVTTYSTVEWIAINPDFSAKVQVQAKFAPYHQDGEYIAFDNAFSGTPHVICTAYDGNNTWPIMAAAYDVSSTGFTVALKDAYGNPAEASLMYIAIVPTSYTNYFNEVSLIAYNQTYSNNYNVAYNLTRAPNAVVCSSWKQVSSVLPYCAAARNITQTGYDLSVYDYDLIAGTSVWTSWIAIGMK